MTFRNSSPKPLAYLISPSGTAVECRLTGLHSDYLIAHIGRFKNLGGRLPLDLILTESLEDPHMEVAVRLQGKAIEEDEYIVKLEQPEAAWQAALAAQSYNRRQAFRVRTKEYGNASVAPDLELTCHLELGSARIDGEALDLSLTGCNLLFPGDTGSELPKEGTTVLVVLTSPGLPEPLRLLARVMRSFQHSKNPRLGLRFQTKNNATWLRIEYQLQDYLMKRQRDQLRFRAA